VKREDTSTGKQRIASTGTKNGGSAITNALFIWYVNG